MTNQRRGLGSRDPLSTNHSSPGHEERYEEQHGHPPADLVRESPRSEHAHTRAREEGEASDPVRRVISNNNIIIIIININAIIFILIINDTIFTITSTSPFSPFSFVPDHAHHYHKSSYHHHYNHHHYITC